MAKPTKMFLVVLVALLYIGCASEKSLKDQMVGMWNLKDGDTVTATWWTFKEDGAMSVMSPGETKINISAYNWILLFDTLRVANTRNIPIHKYAVKIANDDFDHTILTLSGKYETKTLMQL